MISDRGVSHARLVRGTLLGTSTIIQCVLNLWKLCYLYTVCYSRPMYSVLLVTIFALLVLRKL